MLTRGRGAWNVVTSANDSEGVQGMQGLFETVVGLSAAEGLTLRDVGKRYAPSVLVPQLVGTPSEVADQLADLFTSGARDGFVVSPSHLAGAFAEFADGVVPELQRRGLFRHEYAGGTLRSHLELAAPD